MLHIVKSVRNLFAEKSKNTYGYPIPSSVSIKNILFDWPSHEGPYKGAVDFAVKLGTPVVAPLDGRVVSILDKNELYGAGEKYGQYTNHITILHENREYSQMAHIAKGSVTVKVGDKVRTGQQVAITGLNGWMEEPYLEHLHFFVFKLLPTGEFQGVKIRFKDKIIATDGTHT